MVINSAILLTQYNPIITFIYSLVDMKALAWTLAWQGGRGLENDTLYTFATKINSYLYRFSISTLISFCLSSGCTTVCKL